MDFKVLPIPTPPKTQALESNSFRPPALDGSLNLSEIYDWHMHNTPGHPLFIYSDDEGQQHNILWPNAVRAIHKAGKLVRSMVAPNLDVSITPGTPKVIAILAAADMITYYTTLMGIVRAGHTVFPISVRNSPDAIAHLLNKVCVSHILIGCDQALHVLAAEALKLLIGPKPRLGTMPMFSDLFVEEKGFIPLSLRRSDLDDVAIILHSSGSTAFPKPIMWTHYRLLQLAVRPHFGERDLTGLRLACHSIPMFHAMGMLLTCFSASTGLVLTSFQPQSPAILPTPDTVMKGLMDTESDLVFCVPTFIEAWSRNQDYVQHMQTMEGIVYSGGPLNKAIGDSLTDKGINLSTFFGCTEAGIYNNIFPKQISSDWNYFDMAECTKAKFIPDGFGNFEIIILPHAHVLPCVLNTIIDDTPAYATGDLLTPHPTKSGYWAVFGRADDQICHSTGEKTNPGPLETILNQDPHVQSAVIFGTGRFYAGVIVDPKPHLRFDPSDLEALATFRQKIWPSVERLNLLAPQHSRLFKEMVLISKPSKPFTYTAKNTARRQAIIKDYAQEIDELYASIDETTQPTIEPPSGWALPDTLEFVRSVVTTVLKRQLKDEDDMFQYGCDSLQATWIRNTVLNALRRTSDLNTRKLPMNFVYTAPTIFLLSRYISQLFDPSMSYSNGDSTGRRVKDMHDMLAKYSGGFASHCPSPIEPSSGKAIVVLTGSTGGLGSALLAKLLECPEVAHVYAINRRGKGSLLERQKLAMVERGLDIEVLSSSKLSLLEGKLEGDALGLEGPVLVEVRASATHYIYNAYTVNFNLSLVSFEPNIRGLRKVIDLALSSSLSTPPRILFTSSVGVLRNHTGEVPVKEELVDAESAVGSGYTESKWVCEQLLATAALHTPLEPVTIRVGQLSGISTNGYWTEKEWVPSLIKSSVQIGCLPDMDGVVSWLPLDIAAQAIVELRDAPRQVLQIAHPHPVSWTSVFTVAAKALHIPLATYSEWLAKLDEKGSDPLVDRDADLQAKNPALFLRDFFESISASHSKNVSSENLEREAMGMKRLSLRHALETSETLGRVSPLGAADVKKWLACMKLVER